MANYVTDAAHALGGYLKNLGLSIVGQLKVTTLKFLKDFVTDDLGKLAVDACAYAETLTNASGDDKKAAAKAKLVEDAKASGHDLSEFGESVLNFLIETGLQALLAAASKGIVAAEG